MITQDLYKFWCITFCWYTTSAWEQPDYNNTRGGLLHCILTQKGSTVRVRQQKYLVMVRKKIADDAWKHLALSGTNPATLMLLFIGLELWPLGSKSCACWTCWHPLPPTQREVSHSLNYVYCSECLIMTLMGSHYSLWKVRWVWHRC